MARMTRMQEIKKIPNFCVLGVDIAHYRHYIGSMAMNKRMISFTDPQVEFLKREAERLGISVADLVRRIVDLFREGK